MGKVSIKIESESGLAIATCHGVLRLKDAQKSVSALWKTPGWLGKSSIWDFREAQFDISSSDIREVAQFVIQNQPDPPPLKVAFVTKRDVDFGLARIFEVFREDSRTVFRVFKNYKKALDWAWLIETDSNT